MGDMASFWGYEEAHDMEQLGKKLLHTTLELEKIKTEAMEEMKTNKEYIKHLIQLLKFTLHERDEARGQLQKFLNSMPVSATPAGENIPESAVVRKPANSSITESNSFSDSFNYHSHVSSPVESLFDPVLSPCNRVEFGLPEAEAAAKLDHGSMIIENMVKAPKGKGLPQRGKFLEAVLRAGPMLQTLLLSGPLPQWRNPPQLQSFQIPPVTVKALSNAGQLTSSRQFNPMPYGQISCGSAQIQTSTTPMGNFAGMTSGGMLNNNASNGYASLAKRQRFS